METEIQVTTTVASSSSSNSPTAAPKKKSTHRVDVVPIVLEKHPNADALSIARVYHYTVCVRNDEWPDALRGEPALGAYIPPDSVVPDTPFFSFLKNLPSNRRVKVQKLRGVWSQGVLCRAPEGAQIGDDVSEALGVTRFVPPLPQAGGDNEAETGIPYEPVLYDIETWFRYAHLFRDGEHVIATEKIHGANSRYTYDVYDTSKRRWMSPEALETAEASIKVTANNRTESSVEQSEERSQIPEGRMWAGSRNFWRAPSPKSIWWMCLRQNPWLERFCKANPELMVFGELFGAVQDLRYGCKPNQYKFRIFDLWHKSEKRFLNHPECQEYKERHSDSEWAPIIFEGPYDAATVKALADGNSLIPGANNIREGVVLKPLEERNDPEIGRVALKIVSDNYLFRSKE